MNNYLFVISFQLMFYKTLRYCLARALYILIAHLKIQCNSMALISFLFFQCKTAFNVNTCHVLSNISQLLHPDHLKITNCPNLTTVFYPLGNFGQALCIRSCHEDLILTRKSHNCSGIAFIQGDSAGGSKLIEQTISNKRLQQVTTYMNTFFYL